MAPEFCPNCGAEVPPNALACPECGADENSGWSEYAQAQRLDLPDENFDHEEFVRQEFGGSEPSPVRPPGIGWGWWVVAVVLVLLMLGWLSRLFT